MKTHMSFISQCEFKVQRGSETEFLRVAKALVAAVAREPGTLRYQWYTTQKPGHYTIIEEYVDADAAQLHNEHVASLLGELFAIADLVHASLYGELNAYLRNWATGRDGVDVNTPL